ncbi:MAG: rhodanese-like domain-containing protein [Balneolaceae bacterium]|nr:rhodanese-like domain-containing protein [Balneolaceae bacterium]
MATDTIEISTAKLSETLKDTNTCIVDIRPIEAYNGWKLKGEPRGGHIKGAKSIPFKWTQYMDWIEVLDEKNIDPDQPVILYGYSEDQSATMAEQLQRLDYDDISIYNHFEEWVSDESLPMERLPRYRQLVYPAWVKDLISNQNPPEYENDRYVLCHSHYDYYEDYEKGHIPGAVAVNTNSLESTETWNRRTPDELKETLEILGIRHDTTVVVYGRFSSPKYDEEKFPGKSAGHLGAIRCAAIMMYAGVEDVRILNGGITTWEADGFETTRERFDPIPVDDFGAEIPGHPEYMIDTPEAKELLASDEGELVSIRSWEEFIGNRSGYHYIDKKGRIPGALFGNCGSDAYHMENYRNFDHTMREYHEVSRTWKEGGITPDKHIAFYCGTGWRGSEAFMNAWLMGWPQVSVYDGGWYEWCNDPGNPIETGVPTG